MMDLRFTREEMAGIFPVDLENLDTIILYADPLLLDVLYVQRDTPDPRRDWKTYARWQEQNRKHRSVPTGRVTWGVLLPETIDQLYDLNQAYVKKGTVGAEDKMVLWAELVGTHNASIVHAGGLRRNLDEELQGLGAAYYTRLASFLKQKGITHITGIPDIPLERFWAERGMKPYRQLTTHQKQGYLAQRTLASRLQDTDELCIHPL